MMFEVFKRYELSDGAARPSYDEIAAGLGLTTTTVTNHLAAMRREFRRIVLERLREITGSDQEWELEARRLLGGEW
jgi:predicted transcriptional regulator